MEKQPISRKGWQPARLIAIADHVSISHFTLENDICTIGRSPTCHVVVDNRVVSRLHARIERDEGLRYILHDASSANGTFVNGQPRPIEEPYILKNQDTIGFGFVESSLRFEDAEATAQINLARLYYDKTKLVFMLDNQPVKLTAGQFRLLQHLYHHAYDPCTRASCAEVLWGRGYDPVLDDQALDRTISNLRKQLRKIADDSDFIRTQRGIGYVLLPNPDLV